MGDRSSDTDFVFMFNRHWIKEKALKVSVRNISCFSEVSSLFVNLWSKPALLPATWYYFKARNRSIQTRPVWLKCPSEVQEVWISIDEGEHSHPFCPTLEENPCSQTISQKTKGGMGTGATFERNVWGHTALHGSLKPVCLTLSQHVLLHLGCQGIQAEKTKSQLFYNFFS